jgi:hypothetical protein
VTRRVNRGVNWRVTRGPMLITKHTEEAQYEH